MIRNTVIAVGLTLCVFAVCGRTDVAALQIDSLALVSGHTTETSSDVIATNIARVLSDESEQARPAKDKEQSPVTHTVRPGETLTDIATRYDTTWQRLYDKNTAIVDPNTIQPGTTITIPASTETLAERTLPAAAPVSVTTTTTTAVTSTTATTQSVGIGSTAGNAYYAGYCTWYAKSRRPDMPNNLGNADTWVARAAAQGFATGSTPRAGAIGQQGMHVVYVERVNGNGTVTISEMNYEGFGVVSSRTVPAGIFMYIY